MTINERTFHANQVSMFQVAKFHVTLFTQHSILARTSADLTQIGSGSGLQVWYPCNKSGDLLQGLSPDNYIITIDSYQLHNYNYPISVDL